VPETETKKHQRHQASTTKSKVQESNNYGAFLPVERKTNKQENTKQKAEYTPRHGLMYLCDEKKPRTAVSERNPPDQPLSNARKKQHKINALYKEQ
jgi:hypothetical protein